MKTEVKVPAMGESISEATIGNILKPSGSKVSMDDELIELETDKVNQVLYAPKAGIVDFKVSHGDVVKIGQVIGFIESNETSSQKTPEVKVEEPKKEEIPKEEPKKETLEKEQSGGIRRGKEVFIAEVKENEAELVPLKAEPAKGLEKKVEAKPREIRRKMSKIRKVIAARLVEAQQQTAMLTTFNEVDLTQVIALRDKYKEVFVKEHGVKLGFMSFFVFATVSALEAFPNVNSYIEGDEIIQREYYDIGVAVGTDRGVIVPVVRDCDRLTFDGIESAIEGYAKKAREGTIKVEDLQGGGFTITNGGVYGSLLSTPIINPPQSAILGMHKIEKRAVVINDQIVIRPMMYLALSYDHRIIDGKEAVAFLIHIKNCLEDPARLLLNI